MAGCSPLGLRILSTTGTTSGLGVSDYDATHGKPQLTSVTSLFCRRCGHHRHCRLSLFLPASHPGLGSLLKRGRAISRSASLAFRPARRHLCRVCRRRTFQLEGRPLRPAERQYDCNEHQLLPHSDPHLLIFALPPEYSDGAGIQSRTRTASHGPTEFLGLFDGTCSRLYQRQDQTPWHLDLDRIHRRSGWLHYAACIRPARSEVWWYISGCRRSISLFTPCPRLAGQ